MTDWAAWGTTIGTLGLAGVTVAALRSSNRSARVAEQALLVGMRPMLAASRPRDPEEQVQFADGRVFEVGAGRALVREDDGVIYLAIGLRNVGAGIAQLLGYRLEGDSAELAAADSQGAARHLRGDAAPDPATFAPQQRDLYVAPGDAGFWQAALREPGSDVHAAVGRAIDTEGRLTVDVLYADHQGAQRTITRFILLPAEDGWRCDATRYWSLDGEAHAGGRR